MLCNSKEKGDGYHDFFQSEPCPYGPGTIEHKRWSAGWVLGANEAGAIPQLPDAYEAELQRSDPDPTVHIGVGAGCVCHGCQPTDAQ